MIVTRTPFRMSFFGGGTDFPEFFREHGGAVLSTAIDRGCQINLRPLPPFFPYRNELVYSEIERVNDAREIRHPAIREAFLWQNVDGVRLSYEADLPARSGLGTSSSFAVGMLHAIHAMRGETLTARQLAKEAITLERERCGEDGGWQDQIAAAYGGFNRIEFNGDDFTVTPVAASPARLAALNDRLMLFFTGFSRFSFSLQSEHRRAIGEKNAELLSLKALVPEAERVLTGTGDLDDFGRMLHETWQIKRGITHVSTDVIDTVYETARAAGALGGKLLGAGGGGFLLLYAEPEKRDAVRRALSDLVLSPFRFSDKGSRLLDR